MKALTIVAGGLLAMAPMAQAQTAPTAAQMAEQTVQRYAILLGLSSTQEEQALALYTTEFTTEATIRTSEKTAQEALLTAIKADNTANITTEAATLGQLSGEQTLALATAEAGVYALLTSDQQTKFAQMLTAGPGGGGGMGGGPGRGGPGGPR